MKNDPAQTPHRHMVGTLPDAQLIEVNGVRLAVTRKGRGPAVLCLHATGHGGGDFARFAELVANQYEIICVDWPGQGRSDTGAKPASAAYYASLIGSLLDALSINNVILLGNSIGGAAAILFAHEHPDRVRGLVLCNPGGLIELDVGTTRAIGMLVRFFAAGERGARWFGPAFAAYYRWLVLPSRAASAQRKRIIRAGYECAPVLRQAWESFAKPEADIRSQALELAMPVWFAWAKGDKLVALKRCRPTITAVPTATLTLFRGGHAAFLEQPRRFAKAVRKFASALPPS